MTITLSRFFWLLVAAAAPFAAFADVYCNCQYDVPLSWEPDCRSYGQLGDGKLIPWHLANETCLDDMKLNVTSYSRDELFSICPFDNFTNANIQLLINAIRYNPSPATMAVQAAFPQFWTKPNGTEGVYELDVIVYDTRKSPTPPCSQSPNLCWGVITDYFTVTSTATDTACKQLHFHQVFDMKLEQSTAREKLCLNGTNAPASCEPLKSQVADIKAANPSKNCSVFGFGSAAFASSLPTCEAGHVQGSATTSSSGAATKAPTLYFEAKVLMALLLILL